MVSKRVAIVQFIYSCIQFNIQIYINYIYTYLIYILYKLGINRGMQVLHCEHSHETAEQKNIPMALTCYSLLSAQVGAVLPCNAL